MQKAFSLVELSIVLVILGLLTGGILAGQNLIRAAELRSITTEYNRYVSAVQTFRNKYLAIPGDIPNANRFWGDDNAACPDAAIPNGAPGTCNGNGNGFLDFAAAANSTGENLQFWKQMALSGLIEGQYSGLSGNGSAGHSIPNINVPASKAGNACWSAVTLGNFGGSSATDGLYALNYGTALLVGGVDPTDDCRVALLTPEEAWNIDSKLDDGRPAYGKIVARYWNTCARADDGSNANNDLAASYNLIDKSKQCALYFTNAF